MRGACWKASPCGALAFVLALVWTLSSATSWAQTSGPRSPATRWTERVSEVPSWQSCLPKTPHKRDAALELLQRAAEISELPPALLLAVAEAESGFDVEAVSSAGALGMLQAMPATLLRHQTDDPLRAGVLELARLLLEQPSARAALVAYLQGEAGPRPVPLAVLAYADGILRRAQSCGFREPRLFRVGPASASGAEGSQP
jgi:soluble lytic murein transglycosylase-like protein